MKDFDFPAKVQTVDEVAKALRLRKFDELLKLALATAPSTLHAWIAT